MFGGPSASRDIGMGEDVAALVEGEGAEAKAVLWAHNGHAARESGYFDDDKRPLANMGSRLDELFGRKQLIVGFSFNQGAFQGRKPRSGLVDHTAPPAPGG